MQTVKVNITTLPEYRTMVANYNAAFDKHGYCPDTQSMSAAVTFLCNFHQMSFLDMAKGDINNGKTGLPFDIRFGDNSGKLQVITDSKYMS